MAVIMFGTYFLPVSDAHNIGVLFENGIVSTHGKLSNAVIRGGTRELASQKRGELFVVFALLLRRRFPPEIAALIQRLAIFRPSHCWWYLASPTQAGSGQKLEPKIVMQI